MKPILGFVTMGIIALCACGGTDNTLLDGGNDVTVSDGPASDGPITDSGNKDSGDSGNTDANGNDSGGTDSAGGTTFACDTMTCDSATQYCNLQEVGPQQVDGGFTGIASCMAYPTACGNTPSCACIAKSLMCTCTQLGPDITNKCGGV